MTIFQSKTKYGKSIIIEIETLELIDIKLNTVVNNIHYRVLPAECFGLPILKFYNSIFWGEPIDIIWDHSRNLWDVYKLKEYKEYYNSFVSLEQATNYIEKLFFSQDNINKYCTTI